MAYTQKDEGWEGSLCPDSTPAHLWLLLPFWPPPASSAQQCHWVWIPQALKTVVKVAHFLIYLFTLSLQEKDTPNETLPSFLHRFEGSRDVSQSVYAFVIQRITN